jgi:integrase/recombinase XerD
MNPLRRGMRDYLALRRSLGFTLTRHEALLHDFASFLIRKHQRHITNALAIEWATRRAQDKPYRCAQRLSVVRGFARHWHAIDPSSEILPTGLWPNRPARAQPYFYSEQDIRALLAAARSLPSRHPLRPSTYCTVLGLLAVTGMRVSEVLKLHTADIDWHHGVLMICGTKFGKSRLVPLHGSSCTALATYANQRDRCFPKRTDSHFFVNAKGHQLHSSTVRETFAALSRQIGLRSSSVGRGPRLHDFRHRFAVETLLRWYRNGDDPKRCIPILSTYLGHTHVTDTYWYLTGTPELLALAAKKVARRWEDLHAGRR